MGVLAFWRLPRHEARRPPLRSWLTGGRGRTGFREEAMLSLQGWGCKQYRELVDGGAVPEVSCPDPGCGGTRLRGHGWYSRYLGGRREPLRRLRCPRCGVSHALLPEDLCAYRDATLDAVEAALAMGRPSAGAQAAGQSGSSGVQRVRRWLRSAGERFADGVQVLLAPAAGPWWQRAQGVVGAAAGWLTRLRHWLWSRWQCFLGGVSGLYRHGRPRAATAGRSPYLGSCPNGGSAAKLRRG